jgi:hypothetical protein
MGGSEDVAVRGDDGPTAVALVGLDEDHRRLGRLDDARPVDLLGRTRAMEEKEKARHHQPPCPIHRFHHLAQGKLIFAR